MSLFKFKILNGADPNAQYAAIVTKDPLTFYLLNNGIGFLGETPLFGGSTQKTIVKMNESLATAETGKMYLLSNVASTVGGASETLTGIYTYNGTSMTSFSDTLISTYISDILVEDMVNSFTPDNNTIPTTQAIVSYVENKLNDSSLINAKFFRYVTGHTVSQAEFDAAQGDTLNPFYGFPVGDVGLLFTADIDAAAGGEQYYYISLTNYIDVYNAGNTNSIHMTLDTGTNTFTADLNVKTGEDSLLVDATGVSLKKAATVNETTPDAANLITESVLVNYITTQVMQAVQDKIDTAMADVVTYSVDPAV